MYFARGLFKNIAVSSNKQFLKTNVSGIKSKDSVYIFQSGICYHERTKQSYPMFVIDIEDTKEIQDKLKKFFTKSHFMSIPDTPLQYEKEKATENLPELITKHTDIFINLAKNNRKYAITSTLIASYTKYNKYEARLFIENGVIQGIFQKYGSSWAITKETWNKLKTLYIVNKDAMAANPILKEKRSGHTDSDVAKDIKKVVRKVISDSESVDEIPIKKLHKRIPPENVVSKKKKKKLSNTHGKLLDPEEARAEFN